MSKEAPRHKLCNGVKNLFFKKSLGVLLCLRLLKQWYGTTVALKPTVGGNEL